MTWIEQLAQKRDDVRAARAVAVSSTGFSENAMLKATHLGIELRKLEDLTPEDIRSWFSGSVHLEVVSFISFVVHLAQTTKKEDLTPALAKLFDGFSLDSPVLTRARDGARMSPRQAWIANGAESGLFVDVPRDGTRIRRTVDVRSDEAVTGYRLCFGSGLVDIASMEFGVELRVETHNPEDVRAFTYSSTDTRYVESVEFTLRTGDDAYTIGLLRDVSRKRVTAARLLPRNES